MIKPEYDSVNVIPIKTEYETESAQYRKILRRVEEINSPAFCCTCIKNIPHKKIATQKPTLQTGTD
jgi:hypothetical protein